MTWDEAMEVTVKARSHLLRVAKTRGFDASRLSNLVPSKVQGTAVKDGTRHSVREDGSVGGAALWATMSDTILYMRKAGHKDLTQIPRSTKGSSEEERWVMWCEWAKIIESFPLEG